MPILICIICLALNVFQIFFIGQSKVTREEVESTKHFRYIAKDVYFYKVFRKSSIRHSQSNTVDCLTKVLKRS
jgi:hypothetical protein